MAYTFDEIIDRHDTLSVKWDLCPDPHVIPMWVADMDFKAAPFIMDAVRERMEHGVFGYTHVPQRYYDAVIGWFASRRGWHIERDWIRYISGLVPALAVAVDALTKPGDKVVFQTPAYNCFFSCVEEAGREVLASPLIFDASGLRPTYRMDFDDLERKCSDPAATLFILCNPHNPAGRIWSAEDLARVGEICRRHGLAIVSDEIHCELEMPGHRYVPFACASADNADCVTFCSPSKSFNIAGLEIANIVTPDPVKREKIGRTIRRMEMGNVNPLGVSALIAAYSDEGAAWLDSLNAYLYENYLALEAVLKQACPYVRLCALEGTYLAWLDCRCFTAKGISTREIQDSLTAVEKVWINSGTMYGDGDFMRINLACPRSTLLEGARRIAAGLDRLYSQK